MAETRRTLQNINEFIKEELFPVIGIPENHGHQEHQIL